jgi:hypothetical protein
MISKALYFFSFLLLFSCSTSNNVVSNNRIQKRKYTKGYHLQNRLEINRNNKTIANVNYNKIGNLVVDQIMNSNHNSIYQEIDLTSLKEIKFSKNDEIEQLIKTYVKNKPLEVSNHKISKVSKLVIKNKNRVNSLITDCDELIMMDGTEISAKILEITLDEIKYKNCDNPEGPIFTKSLSSVFKIKYSNGTSQVIKTTEQANSNNNDDILNMGLEEGEKSQSIALALWFLFGILGVHRFYLGHTGIGWIIDGIQFLTGKLKPADGKDYGEKIL